MKKNLKLPGAIILEGHVQGLSNCRALGELGIPIYVCDVVHCLAQHSKYCKKHFICPPFNSEAFIDFLVELGKQEGLKGWFLIGSNDHIVENIALHRKQLEPYYTFMVPTMDNLYYIINKKQLLDVAAACGTSIPQTCYINDIERAKEFRYPLLIKGNQGLSFYKATHQKALQADSYEELLQIVNHDLKVSKVDTSEVMIQELIPFDKSNRVVSFTCFAENGDIKTYWMGQKLREHPIKYGTATCSQSVLIPEVLEEAKPLVAALRYTGTCEIEFMRDPRDKQWKLIEINPRTWLWVGLAKECGVDYAKIMYRYTHQIQQDYPKSYKVGLKWRNSITDVVFSILSISKKLFTLRDYLLSLRGPKMHAIFSWEDIMPGIVFPFMSFYIAKKRR